MKQISSLRNFGSVVIINYTGVRNESDRWAIAARILGCMSTLLDSQFKEPRAWALQGAQVEIKTWRLHADEGSQAAKRSELKERPLGALQGPSRSYQQLVHLTEEA